MEKPKKKQSGHKFTMKKGLIDKVMISRKEMGQFNAMRQALEIIARQNTPFAQIAKANVKGVKEIRIELPTPDPYWHGKNSGQISGAKGQTREP